MINLRIEIDTIDQEIENVMEKIEKKELSWFPKQKESNEEGDGGGDRPHERVRDRRL